MSTLVRLLHVLRQFCHNGWCENQLTNMTQEDSEFLCTYCEYILGDQHISITEPCFMYLIQIRNETVCICMC